MEKEDAAGSVGATQALHVGAEPEKSPVATLQARTATVPQKPALHVQFHVPGVAVSCAVAVGSRGGAQGEGAVEPSGQ